MADCYDRPPISVTPCEFENANDECPIGYINTSCITYNGDDEVISGVLNNESLNLTLQKIITHSKTGVFNIVSNTCTVTNTTSDNGVVSSIEVNISSDPNNQLTYGTDGKLFSVKYQGTNYTDSNSINFTKNNINNNVTADIKYVQSATVNLSTTPTGLKADISQSILDRIIALENKVF